MKNYWKDWYKKNKRKRAEYNKKYYLANIGRLKKMASEYKKKNKEQIAEYNRQYYLKNKLK
jgi:hypothetical protein